MKKTDHQDGVRRALIRNQQRQLLQPVVEPRRWARRIDTVCTCSARVSINCPVKHHQELARRQGGLQWD